MMISGPVCCSSNININTNINTDLLRTQLDQLHSEVGTTRRKANNTRFRLLRLSEAAENLCQQAAVSIRKGKENDARELLVQKKKIMLALEKSKSRVELLDKLAAKLSEAISIKEAQLVENVASDLQIDGDVGSPVRIVSPTPDRNINLNHSDVDENHESNRDEGLRVPDSSNNVNKATVMSSVRGLSSYINFLEDLDQQLDNVEKDLMKISEHSTSVPKIEEHSYNSRVQQISEVLVNIRDTRVRIGNFLQKIVETC